jgi:hypothetical protein
MKHHNQPALSIFIFTNCWTANKKKKINIFTLNSLDDLMTATNSYKLLNPASFFLLVSLCLPKQAGCIDSIP